MGTKVLLAGINTYPDCPLKGCVADVMGMRDVLQQRYAIGSDRIRVLVDQQATTTAIVDGLRWLAEPEQDGSPAVRLFHYSGHGTFLADTSGDEPDGRDECIVPVDYATAGPMTDDALRQLYARFGSRSHLLLIMDCCHSGSIQRDFGQDVRYRFLPNSFEEEQRIEAAAERFQERRQQYVTVQLSDLRERTVPEDEWQRRIKAAMDSFDKQHWGQAHVRGNVVLLAACRSDQTAADARFDSAYNGAFSYFLLDALRNAGNGLTYRSLIDLVGSKLYQANFRQVPQLECSSTNAGCGFMNLPI
jgi:hypothetical protein